MFYLNIYMHTNRDIDILHVSSFGIDKKKKKIMKAHMHTQIFKNMSAFND